MTKCSLCGSPGTNKLTCPKNPKAFMPNPLLHPNAGATIPTQPVVTLKAPAPVRQSPAPTRQSPAPVQRPSAPAQRQLPSAPAQRPPAPTQRQSPAPAQRPPAPTQRQSPAPAQRPPAPTRQLPPLRPTQLPKPKLVPAAMAERPTAPSGPAQVLDSEFSRLNLRDETDDWTKNLVETTVRGWDTYRMPAGTLIYRGSRVSARVAGAMVDRPTFFGSLAVAAYYAFEQNSPEFGKVEQFMTTGDLLLINMDSRKNMRKLAGLNASALEYTFGTADHPERYSDADQDMIFCRWLQDYFQGSGLHGYAYKNLPGFHNEVMTYALQHIQKTAYEYRWSLYHDSRNLLVIRDGRLDGKIPISGLSYMIGETEHRVAISGDVRELYIPNNPPSEWDRYLIEEPLQSARVRQIRSKLRFYEDDPAIMAELSGFDA